MKKLKIYLIGLLMFAGCRKEGHFNNISPHDFLSDVKYDKLIVEIQYVNGYEPSATAISNLVTFLQKRLNKYNGVTVVKNNVSSPGKISYTLDDIKEIEKERRTQKTNGGILTAYIFFADADYSNSQVLGIAYGSTSIVVFEKTVMDFSGGFGQPPTSALETTVIDHEFGHLLGLVNNGTTMQINHQDNSNGKHCANRDCLMYYNVETTDVISNILGGNIPELDANCANDLHANGGK